MTRSLFPRDQKLSAVAAKSYAQWIAFAPFAFQTACTLRDTGLLSLLRESGARGETVAALAAAAQLSEYGVSVLLDFGEHLGLVVAQESRFRLGSVGEFMLDDAMTRVNMDFTRDVCYQALPFLEQSIRDGKPAGLHTLGDWATVYEGLTQLEEPARGSWFAFDHFYSDRLFDELLPIVFEQPVRELLDVGGNTGRWALRCLDYDPDVRVVLMDLPNQLAVARQNIEQAGFGARAGYHQIDLLDDAQPFHRGADALWMSQFLDCFGEDDIRRILRRAAAAMSDQARLYIVELFPDRQRFDAAAYSLDATSLYFTCVANGNSRMYRYDAFRQLVLDAGLRIEREIDDVGVGHTVLVCRR